MGLPRRTAFSLPLPPLAALAASACGISIRAGSAAGPGASSASNSSSAAPEREAPRIGVDEAFAAIRAGRAVIVDVRGPESFRQRRAAGAMLVTLEEIEKSPRDALARLPAGLQPILYCT